jgi:hypothetical protein
MLTAVADSNWFGKEPPALVIGRALPRFPLPTAEDVSKGHIKLPKWLTPEVWQASQKFFALPPVSKNYPHNDGVDKIFKLTSRKDSTMRVVLKSHDLSNFSTEYRVSDKATEKIASLPCVLFSVDNGLVFRIPAAQHQLFALWLMESGHEDGFERRRKLEWETPVDSRIKKVRRKLLILLKLT